MSAAHPDSVARLAQLACRMPWEDKAPLSARVLFKEAVTPELFVELVDALRALMSYCENTCVVRDREGREIVYPAFEQARAAIAKATGGAA